MDSIASVWLWFWFGSPLLALALAVVVARALAASSWCQNHDIMAVVAGVGWHVTRLGEAGIAPYLSHVSLIQGVWHPSYFGHLPSDFIKLPASR
jgi:hypothetical protein